jgi:O-antigen/teichoic acid export membrane protein
MTWASYLTKSLTFVLVLPLVLTRLDAGDIALWYLFSTIIGLQLLADLGFSPTFVRVIAYAMAGAGVGELREAGTAAPAGRRPADWGTVERIWATMRVVYNRLTLVSMAALALGGTLAVMRPVGASPHPGRAWIAWGVILAGSTVALRGNVFAAYLQGVNQVAVLRRWEALTNLGTIVASAVVLRFGGGLLGLVVVAQLGTVLNLARNWWLSRAVEEARFRGFTARGADRRVLEAVWPSAWRSGLGMLMAHAPVQVTGLFFAQVGAPAAVATYLLGLNLFVAIRNFSTAPFYSRLPVLSRLRAQGDLAAQRVLAQRGMRLSYWSFVLLFVGLGVAGGPLLRLIGSNAAFPDPVLWSLLGVGMFLERFGGMHLQLYSTTNHVTWHIANGVTAALFAGLSVPLYGALGVNAFALAYIGSYLGFFVWYSARQSYSILPVSGWEFERTVSLAPTLAVLAYTALSLGALPALF